MIETEKARKRKAKDRDGVYKRRGHWHFDYKDPQTGQWRSKTTGKTNYNDAKEFKREFLKSLKGQYNPSNDRLKFMRLRTLTLNIAAWQRARGRCNWRKSGYEQ